MIPQDNDWGNFWAGTRGDRHRELSHHDDLVLLVWEHVLHDHAEQLPHDGRVWQGAACWVQGPWAAIRYYL